MDRAAAALRTSPRPLRVLGVGRRLQDRRARPARGGVRPARARAHRPRGDERRGRALQGLQEARDQAHHRPRGVPGRRHPHRCRPLRAQPPDAAGARRRGLPQPRKAVLGGLPRGLQARQGQRGHGAARPLLGRRDRAHRLPPVPLLPAARERQPGRRPRARRRPDAGLRGRERLLRGPEERHPRAGQGERRHRPDRERGGPPAGRNRRRALPAPRGLRQPPRAALRPDQEHARRAEALVRHQRVLPQGLGRDGGGLRRVARGARHHASRSPTAARSRSSSARC